MHIAIRPFEPQDYASVLEVYTSAAPLGIHSPEAEASNSRIYVAEEPETRKVVGFAVVPMKEWYSFDLVVSPRWQRQGIGRLLWERFSQDLAEVGATAVEPWVREENVAGIAWLIKNRFAPTKLDGPVSLFLNDVDLSPLESADTHVINKGFVITTLACEREHDPKCLTKLHSLYNKVSADAPHPENYHEKSLEDFVRVQDEPEAMPEAYFIAKYGSDYVGLSYIRPRSADPNCVEPGNVQQCLTGVLPEYRRRRIATALKIKTIISTREQGFRRLLTNSDNPAMQALNKKLGFTSGPWRVFRKELPARC